MAKRDMVKTAEKVNEQFAKGKLSNYCLDLDEIRQLMEIATRDGYYAALTTSFNYGFVCGVRAFKNNRIPAL